MTWRHDFKQQDQYTLETQMHMYASTFCDDSGKMQMSDQSWMSCMNSHGVSQIQPLVNLQSPMIDDFSHFPNSHHECFNHT